MANCPIITKFTFTYIYRFMPALISPDMYVTCTTGFTVSMFSFENQQNHAIL